MTNNFNDNDLYQYPPFNPHRADPIWNLDSDYLVPVVSSVGNGPKGDKGDPLVFDDLTDEQMQKVLQDANYVGNKAEEATYITGSGTTSVIEIPIADFDQFDMLFVDIEGLDLHEGADYDIVGDNIILNTPITHSGTKVHFKALSYTLIDGDKTIENVMGHHDYDTVATMKLDADIELGAICHTLGFNSKGDKGAAWYKVTDDAIATETDVISLDNGYYAIMYKDDESVNPEMLGVFDYTLAEWAGTTQSYSKRTVVYWGSSAYTARQDVPTGIQITNEEYWVPWKNIAALLDIVDDLSTELGQEIENRKAADETLTAKIGKYYTPEQFGAIGDGVANDTQAIQDAVNAAIADVENAFVKFSNSYLITDTINVDGAVILFGETVQEYYPRITVNFNGVGFEVTHSSFCISNICFYAGTSYRWAASCIHVVPQAADVDMFARYCKFFYFDKCIHIEGRSITVENCNFSNSGYGVYIQDKENASDSMRSYRIFANRFHAYGRTGESAYNGYGVFFNFRQTYTVNDVFISENYADRGNGGIFIGGNCPTGIIENNYITRASNVFIDFSGDAASSEAKHTLIKNNVFSVNPNSTNVNAINMTNCKQVDIVENTFVKAAGNVINCLDCSYVNVYENEIKITSDDCPDTLMKISYENARTLSPRFEIKGNKSARPGSTSRILDYVVLLDIELAEAETLSTANFLICDNEIVCKNVCNQNYSAMTNYYAKDLMDVSPVLSVNTPIQIGATMTPFIIMHTSAGCAIAFTAYGTTAQIIGASTLGNVIIGSASFENGLLTITSLDEISLSGQTVTQNLTVNRIVVP